MAIKLDVSVRNARLDAVETVIFAADSTPELKLYTGTPPSSITTAATGSLLATIVLPGDFFANASSGTKVLSGTWSVNATGAGTFGYFRICATGATGGLIQGTAGTSGTDLIMSSASCSIGQTITVTGFTMTDGNA